MEQHSGTGHTCSASRFSLFSHFPPLLSLQFFVSAKMVFAIWKFEYYQVLWPGNKWRKKSQLIYKE